MSTCLSRMAQSHQQKHSLAYHHDFLPTRLFITLQNTKETYLSMRSPPPAQASRLKRTRRCRLMAKCLRIASVARKAKEPLQKRHTALRARLKLRPDLNTAKGNTAGDDVINAARQGFDAVSDSDSVIQKAYQGFDNLTRSSTLGPVVILVRLERPPMAMLMRLNRPFTVKFVSPRGHQPTVS